MGSMILCLRLCTSGTFLAIVQPKKSIITDKDKTKLGKERNRRDVLICLIWYALTSRDLIVLSKNEKHISG